MQAAMQSVFEHDSSLVLPLCLTLYDHSDQQGKKLLEHQFAHSFVEIVHNIKNTVTKGSFQIKLDQTDSFMLLSEPQKEQVKRWNIKEGRFTNSGKIGKNYYVQTGGIGDFEVSSLWHLCPVENTKYFQIRSLASDGTHATIIASENGKQLYASAGIDQQNEASFFSICPRDQSGKKFEFISKTKLMLSLPEDGNSSYINMSKDLSEEKVTYNLISYTKVPTNRIRTYSNESTETESKYSGETDDSKMEPQAENEMNDEVENPTEISENDKYPLSDMSLYSQLPLSERLQYTKSTKFNAFGNTIIRASYTMGMF